MDEKLQIQLGSEKHINSTTVDTYGMIELKNKKSEILEYDVRNVLSVTEVFDIERNESKIYRIYGKINWLSILNGLRKDYDELADFFTGGTSDVKTIFDSFEFYLVRPDTGFTKITSSTTDYVRYFKVIAVPQNFEIYSAGFDKNVFGEQTYAFNFNIDFDITEYFDDFGFPATELFLYAEYNPSTNGEGILEGMSATTWSTTTGDPSKVTFSPSPLNVGDRIYGDKIQYLENRFSQEQIASQQYYIRTHYKEGYTNRYLRWRYNPFIPFRLRYFSSEVKRANTGTTAYEQAVNIPAYATDLGDGNKVWRDILPQGYIDPLTGDGVDYPFINKRRYLFSEIVLSIVTDLTDSWTAYVFDQIDFADPTSLNFSPLGDIDDIGKPCQ